MSIRKYQNSGVVQDATKVDKSNRLNQGKELMEFVIDKANTVRDHTLDGYDYKNGYLIEDKTKSFQGYLKAIDNSNSMYQLGTNLYTKIPVKAKDMINGIANLLRQVKDKNNRKGIYNYVIKDFKKQNIDYNEKEFKESVMLKKGGAWTRKEGQNSSGGLNQKGRDSYNRENPGSNLKAPQPEGGKRRDSYCARSAGQMKMFPKAAKDPNSRLRLARKKWNC
jgi:hypothetical protein